jgi:hypothetical protein
MYELKSNEIVFDLDGEEFIGRIHEIRPPYVEVTPVVMPTGVTFWMEVIHIDAAIEAEEAAGS